MSIRLGVIGAGKFGYNHLLALSQAARSGAAELVAVADLNADLLEQRRIEFDLKGYTDFREMIEREKLTAVTIATPDHLHREIALHAARSGLHMLVEKPLDLTEEGCEEIIQAAAENGVLLQVDFHKRFDPEHREMARRIRQGELGEILYGYAHMEDRIEVPSRWFPGWAARSSPAWFLAIHFFDLVRWAIEAEPVRVFATGQKAKLAAMGLDTFDAIQAKVDFANGASVTFDTSWILPDSFESIVNQGLRLVGTEGIFEIDSQDRGASSCIAGEGMRTYNNHFIRTVVAKDGRPHYAGYGIESIADFVENLVFLDQGGTLASLAGSYPGGYDGLQATRMALAAHRSIAEGRPVDLST
jgi:predicted dehydrogenase